MNFSTVITPLRKILLSWINQYSLSVQYQTLNDLSNCQFFNLMLSRVNGFKWVQQKQWNNFKDLPTGQRVKRVRIVGRSITKFYQNQLDLSLDNLALNYIEMCTSQQQNEILRLFIASIGVLVRQVEIVNQLQTYMVELGQEQLGLFKIMIDYASKIGEKTHSDNESPNKRQKKLVSRLQIVQQDLQFYQNYTEQLQSKLQNQVQQSERFKKKVQILEKEGKKLVKKIEQFENITENMGKELKQKNKQQQILLQRLASNRKSAQQIVDKLIEQNQQLREQIKKLRSKCSEKNGLELQIKRISLECQQKNDLIQTLKSKMEEQKSNNSKLEKDISQLRQKIQLQVSQSQQHKLKLDLYQKTFKNNRTNYLSPDQQSIVIPTTLGDSYVEKTPKQWFAVTEEQLNHSRMNESLNFSNYSQNVNTFPQHVGYLELRDLQSPKQQNNEKQNINPNIPQKRQTKALKIEELDEDNSFEMPSKQQDNNALKSQLELAVTTILQLQNNLQESRKQLWKYKQQQAIKKQRSARFAAKVNTIF